jgi:hypothetical protein
MAAFQPIKFWARRPVVAPGCKPNGVARLRALPESTASRLQRPLVRPAWQKRVSGGRTWTHLWRMRDNALDKGWNSL